MGMRPGKGNVNGNRWNVTRRKRFRQGIGSVSMIASLILSGCSAAPVRSDVQDHVCRTGDVGCIPVTQGFIEERVRNLVEIHRLKQELRACEVRP